MTPPFASESRYKRCFRLPGRRFAQLGSISTVSHWPYDSVAQFCQLKVIINKYYGGGNSVVRRPLSSFFLVDQKIITISVLYHTVTHSFTLQKITVFRSSFGLSLLNVPVLVPQAAPIKSKQSHCYFRQLTFQRTIQSRGRLRIQYH